MQLTARRVIPCHYHSQESFNCDILGYFGDMKIANRYSADFVRRRTYRKHIRIFTRQHGQFIPICDKKDDLVTTVYRPVEDMVINKIMYNKDYDFDDSVYQNRIHNLEFSSFDYQLYLLLLYLKNKYRFGHSDASQKEEREMLSQCCKILNVNRYDMVVFYAELLTKIERRKRANLRDIPVIPENETAKHESIIKRIDVNHE